MESSKLKWSNFHITANFNVDSEDHIRELVNAVEEMVEHPYLWWWLKQYDGERRVDFDMVSKMDVQSVRLRAGVEHGGTQNHGLHVHILVEVAHRTMVQVDKEGIIDTLEHFVGLKPNVHVRFVKGEGDDKDFILRYIQKEVPSLHRQTKAGNRRLAMAMGDPLAEVANRNPA